METANRSDSFWTLYGTSVGWMAWSARRTEGIRAPGGRAVRSAKV